MNDTLTLRNDYLFKRLLGAEENKACLQDFLECVLDIGKFKVSYQKDGKDVLVDIGPMYFTTYSTALNAHVLEKQGWLKVSHP